jgi:hypothetical protein
MNLPYSYRCGRLAPCLLFAGLWSLGKVLYPPAFCTEVDLSTYVWFQYVLQDKACKSFLLLHYSYSILIRHTNKLRFPYPPSSLLILRFSLREYSPHLLIIPLPHIQRLCTNQHPTIRLRALFRYSDSRCNYSGYLPFDASSAGGWTGAFCGLETDDRAKRRAVEVDGRK